MRCFLYSNFKRRGDVNTQFIPGFYQSDSFVTSVQQMLDGAILSCQPDKDDGCYQAMKRIRMDVTLNRNRDGSKVSLSFVSFVSERGEFGRSLVLEVSVAKI